MRDRNGNKLFALWKINLPEDYRLIAAADREKAAEIADVSEELISRMGRCYASGKPRLID